MSADWPDVASRDFCAALMCQQIVGIADRHGFAPMSMVAGWAAGAAHCLACAGLTPEEPVLVEISGVAEDVAGILTVITAGGVAVPVHAKAHENTSAHVRTQTGARFYLRFVRGVATGGVPEVQISAPTPPPVRPLLSGAAMITFTSGSTGKPKGVVLSLDRMSAKPRSCRKS